MLFPFSISDQQKSLFCFWWDALRKFFVEKDFSHFPIYSIYFPYYCFDFLKLMIGRDFFWMNNTNFSTETTTKNYVILKTEKYNWTVHHFFHLPLSFENLFKKCSYLCNSILNEENCKRKESIKEYKQSFDLFIFNTLNKFYIWVNNTVFE